MKTLVLNIVPWVVAALSLAGVAAIVLRKRPVLLKLPVRPPEGQEQVFLLRAVAQRFVLRLRGLRYSSFGPAMAAWFEKILRKLRLLLLKIDNVFLRMIGSSREKTQIWTVRSRAWMEQHRLKKIKKLEVLEKLDQAEIIETIQKAKEDVKNGNGKKEKKMEVKKPEISDEELKQAEERNCIDMIARDPRNIEAYRRLGFLYCEQGNKEDAKNCFKQVLKLNPDDLEVISKMKELV
jgi:tetratricopeptide (TPR) repeat protein